MENQFGPQTPQEIQEKKEWVNPELEELNVTGGDFPDPVGDLLFLMAS